MFGSRVVINAPEHHEHTHVQMVDPSVEKGARFLDETLREAHKRVVSSMLVEVPEIGIRVVRYELDRVMATDQRRHRICFTLNGREIDVGLDRDDWEDMRCIVAIVAEHIAAEVMRIALTKNPALIDHIGYRKKG